MKKFRKDTNIKAESLGVRFVLKLSRANMSNRHGSRKKRVSRGRSGLSAENTIAGVDKHPLDTEKYRMGNGSLEKKVR